MCRHIQSPDTSHRHVKTIPKVPASSYILPRSKDNYLEYSVLGIIDVKMRSNRSHIFKHVIVRTKTLQQAEETSRYRFNESQTCEVAHALFADFFHRVSSTPGLSIGFCGKMGRFRCGKAQHSDSVDVSLCLFLGFGVFSLCVARVPSFD